MLRHVHQLLAEYFLHQGSPGRGLDHFSELMACTTDEVRGCRSVFRGCRSVFAGRGRARVCLLRKNRLFYPVDQSNDVGLGNNVTYPKLSGPVREVMIDISTSVSREDKRFRVKRSVRVCVWRISVRRNPTQKAAGN